MSSPEKATEVAEEQPNPEQVQPVGETRETQSGNAIFLLALTGGLVGFSSSLFFALLGSYQLKLTMEDLQTQFDSMYAGNYNVKATIYSEDELGQLSHSFNQLSRVILTTTNCILYHSNQLYSIPL